jgi:hypothetical protein
MTEPMATTPTRRTYGERIVGAIKLDSAVYDEIENDPESMGQAAGVVVLAAIAAGIGGSGSFGIGHLLGGALGSLLGWVVSTVVVWLVGVRFMHHTSDYPDLLRTLGFAAAPRIFLILGVLPLLGPLAVLVVGIWGLVAYVVAVRQALDVTTGRAVVVCIIAYLVAVAIAAVLVLLGGMGGGAGPGPSI